MRTEGAVTSVPIGGRSSGNDSSEAWNFLPNSFALRPRFCLKLDTLPLMLNASFLLFLSSDDGLLPWPSCLRCSRAPVSTRGSSERSFTKVVPDTGAEKDLMRFLGDTGSESNWVGVLFDPYLKDMTSDSIAHFFSSLLLIFPFLDAMSCLGLGLGSSSNDVEVGLLR